MSEKFHKFSQWMSNLMGTPWAFLLALATIVVWGITGPIFGFSDTWQLVINTGTTIVTFLMVFLIQNTQNRDSRATQLKLDELIRATGAARNKLINLEELSDKELNELHAEFCELQKHIEDRVESIEAHKADRKEKGHKRSAKKSHK